MNKSCRTLQESLSEYGRGIAGGLLFSLPLLYTMEMWWAAFIAHPLRLLAYVLSTLVLLLAYNRFAGLREDASWVEVLIDSIEELGIGLILSAFILWLLGRISSDMTSGEVVSKIVMEAMTVAIGVSVGTAQLGASSEDEGQNENSSHSDNQQEPNFLEQVVLGFCGSVLIAANVGPTEEIVQIAVESPLYKLLGMAAFSLLIATVIMNFSSFHGAKKLVIDNTPFYILRGAVVTYAVALISAAAICWFFGRFDGASPIIAVAQTVVLAFPATLGASAGRLLIQSNAQ